MRWRSSAAILVPAFAMMVAAVTPLPLGVVEWRAPEPMLGLIVKTTFDLDGRPVAAPSARQEPLHENDCGAYSGDELEYATDFVPRKGCGEVLVVGDAHSPSPCTELDVCLDYEGVSKRCRAVARVPTTRVSLERKNLRHPDGRVGAGLGPSRASHQWRFGALAESFDYRRLNVAPDDQQVPVLAPTGRLILEGLLADQGRLETRIPLWRPQVFVVPPEGGSAVFGIMLACDTLWIHTTRALATLTWRAAIPLPEVPVLLVVAATHGGGLLSWSEVSSKAARASWYEAATSQQTSLARASASDPAPDSDHATLTRSPSWGPLAEPTAIFDSGDPPEKTAEPPPFATQHLAPSPEPTPFRRDVTLTMAERPELPAVPFRRDDPAAGRRRRDDTLDLASDPRAAELRRAMSSAPLPFDQERTGARGAEDEDTLKLADPRSDQIRAVLAKVSVGNATRRETLELDAQDGSGPATPFEQAAAAPAAEASGAADEPQLSLETYAAIKVALLRGDRGLHAVLAEHGVDEVLWRLEERRRADLLSRAAALGDRQTIEAMRRAMILAAKR